MSVRLSDICKINQNEFDVIVDSDSKFITEPMKKALYEIR